MPQIVCDSMFPRLLTYDQNTRYCVVASCTVFMTMGYLLVTSQGHSRSRYGVRKIQHKVMRTIYAHVLL